MIRYILSVIGFVALMTCLFAVGLIAKEVAYRYPLPQAILQTTQQAQPQAQQDTFQAPKPVLYNCPVHGKTSFALVLQENPNEQPHVFCLKCLREALSKVIPELTMVNEEPVKESK